MDDVLNRFTILMLGTFFGWFLFAGLLTEELQSQMVAFFLSAVFLVIGVCGCIAKLGN